MLSPFVDFANGLADVAAAMIESGTAVPPGATVKADKTFVTELDLAIETRLRAQIEAEIDGKPWVLGTDASWKCAPSSNQRRGGMIWGDFGGERVDAAADIPNWSNPDFDDKDWKNAVVVEAPKGEAVAQQAPLNRIGKEIAAVAVNDLGGGKYEIDFGTALTGWLRLKMPAWNAEPDEIADDSAAPQGPANLKILKATYAALDGAGSGDVTAKVAAMVKDDALNFEVNPGALGGDPVPNHVKDLIVEYELHGKSRSTRAADFSQRILWHGIRDADRGKLVDGNDGLIDVIAFHQRPFVQNQLAGPA